MCNDYRILVEKVITFLRLGRLAANISDLGSRGIPVDVPFINKTRFHTIIRSFYDFLNF